MKQFPKDSQIDVPTSAFISPYAHISGKVSIGNFCSVWPYAVLRGDLGEIVIRDKTNIQEHVVIHVSVNYNVDVGQSVTIGHGAIIHGCHIGNDCLIGMHSTLLDGVQVGDECIIGANTLLTQGQSIPARSLVLGSPGKVVRQLTDKDLRLIHESAQVYLSLIQANTHV